MFVHLLNDIFSNSDYLFLWASDYSLNFVCFCNDRTKSYNLKDSYKIFRRHKWRLFCGLTLL